MKDDKDTFLVFLLFAIVIIAISLWVEYLIATSSLPDWMKFALLQR